MVKAKRVVFALFILLILLEGVAWSGEKAAAQEKVRQTTIVVPYTEYEWWLISWEDNQILCRILVDHEGVPTANEVLKYCGSSLQDQWKNTPPCKIDSNEKNTTNCAGLYLHLISSQPKERQVVIEMPPPSVGVTLEGCNPTPPDNRCPTIPTLVLSGEEPLPNERIIAIHGTYGGISFNCEGNVCKIPLGATPLQGVTVEFWADSSFGDSSEHFTAQVRVIDTGVSSVPGGSGWYVDVISSQWRGAPIATCARIWQAFPPMGVPPTWLASPDQSQLMASDAPYYYLAGRLISQGLVNVTECSTGGLLPNGYADACGLDKARTLVQNWQNQFDKQIVKVSKESGVPAQLMKNLFAQESQFWPGVFRVPFEFGLGQITEKGAETVLLWNSTFFDQFCPLVLSEDTCKRGYLHLKAEDQAILRGALALQAKTDCATCPTGVDLSEANFSISFFANTLQANCAQVNQTIYTATQKTSGSVSTYEDLWRFTVANYQAGPGCLAYAINQAWQGGGVLNWEAVSTRFTDPCKGVVPYVDKITR